MKMTNSAALSYALTNLANCPDDVRERLEAMRASLDKRSADAKGKERKLSPKQQAEAQERETFREGVLARMAQEPNRLWTVKELAEAFGVNNPKMSATLTALVKAGKVKREEGKNRTITFQYIQPTEETEVEGE